MRIRKVLALSLMLIFLFSALYQEPVLFKALGENWLSTFSYRKRIRINNSTGAGTNYQINITVNKGAGSDTGYNVFLGNNCTDFPNDIAFSEDDGNTTLYHWGRSIDANTELFWFRVTDNLNSTNQDVYIYYGLTGQDSTNDFSHTFIFGDPFDNTTLNTQIWASTTGNPVYTIDANNHYLQVTDIDKGWTSGYGFHSNTTLVFPYGWIMQDAYGNVSGVYHYIADSAGDGTIYSRMGISVHNANWGADQGITHTQLGDFWNSENYMTILGVGGNNDWVSGAQGAGANSTYFEVYKPNGTIYIDERNMLRHSEANSETVDRVHILVAGLTGKPFGTQRVGAFLIRKYVDPEPTINSFGAVEQIPMPAPENISCVITNIESGNRVFPPDEYYIFRAVTRDNNTDLHNITVAFSDGASWGNVTFHLDTNTWTRDDGLNIIVLNASACSNQTIANLTIADFHIRFREEVQEASLVDIYMRSIDAEGSEDAFEIVNNNYFNIVKGIELIEYSSNVLLFFVSIIILILSLVAFRFGVLLGGIGTILSFTVLLPNIIDPSTDAVTHAFMIWIMILNIILLLGAFVMRRRYNRMGRL